MEDEGFTLLLTGVGLLHSRLAIYGINELGSNDSVCGSTVAQAIVNLTGARFYLYI